MEKFYNKNNRGYTILIDYSEIGFELSQLINLLYIFIFKPCFKL